MYYQTKPTCSICGYSTSDESIVRLCDGSSGGLHFEPGEVFRINFVDILQSNSLKIPESLESSISGLICRDNPNQFVGTVKERHKFYRASRLGLVELGEQHEQQHIAWCKKYDVDPSLVVNDLVDAWTKKQKQWHLERANFVPFVVDANKQQVYYDETAYLSHILESMKGDHGIETPAYHTWIIQTHLQELTEREYDLILPLLITIIESGENGVKKNLSPHSELPFYFDGVKSLFSFDSLERYNLQSKLKRGIISKE